MKWHQGFHTKYDWENPDVTSINREPAHSPWGAYEDFEQASTCDRTRSKWTLPLDGSWRFRYCERPTDADPFWEPGYDHGQWKPIQVPGDWEVQGFGEPIYTNIVYPWNHSRGGRHIVQPDAAPEACGLPNPPAIPEENPTGCYHREFTLPKEWVGREIFLQFDGVETAFYCWVNGGEVGYSEDSRLPCGFDVTTHVREGLNRIDVLVLRFASSIYMEDQDYWFLTGIHRSVRLVAKPGNRIVDWRITAVPDLQGSAGAVVVDIAINRVDGFASCSVRLDILDAQGRPLGNGISKVVPQAQYRMKENPTANTARIRIALERIDAWTPETPTLYKAIMTLLSPDGHEADFESCRIGFRRIEIVDGAILLNGKRLILRGVNRHEHEAHVGHAVGEDRMVEEIRLMKRLGINAVRTCHYPDHPVWFDLCDEWGLLLVCECNLETHGVAGALTHDPTWGAAFLERAIRMVMTHQNHPSIYAWSLGNESGTGPNHAAMAGWIREHDAERICQYEAGNPGKNISDVRCDMYATQERILQLLTDPGDDRPVVLVEYLYQIRNSGGGMHKFRELVERYRRFQGGFIWDWQDKCLVARTPEGEEYYGYGGDFGESVVDWIHPPFMCCNGIVLPDLSLKPVAFEVKQAYCPVTIEVLGNDDPWRQPHVPCRYRLRNRNLVLDTTPYDAVYAIRENGHVIGTGPFDLPLVPAGEDREVVFAPDIVKRHGAEYHLEFSVRYARDTAFAQVGFELGRFQFRLDDGTCAPGPATCIKEGELLAESDQDRLIIRNGKHAVSFDRTTGLLRSCQADGVEHLASGPMECFSRPRTGIDACPEWGYHADWGMFGRSGMQSTLKCFQADSQEKGTIRIETVREVVFPDSLHGASISSSYAVHGNGRIEVRTLFRIYGPCAGPARVGAEFIIPEGFEHLEYFGLGPVENYRDRKHAAILGVFGGKVEDEHFPFIPPSENGGHEETRWVILSDWAGHTIRFSSPIPFHFDVHHNTVEDYRSAGHDIELIRRKESYLHIDAAHAGIGGDMGWSTVLREEDEIEEKNLILAYTIQMI
jgi:beta-galactosidase